MRSFQIFDYEHVASVHYGPKGPVPGVKKKRSFDFVLNFLMS
jgi:hypothetical protein